VDRWIDAVLATEFRNHRDQWEDLRQEIQMRVLLNLRQGRFRGESELRTYVHRIARNTSIDALRRSGSRRTAMAQGADALGPPSAPAHERLLSRDLLEKLLLEMSGDDRELLALVFVDNLSYSKVAERLQVAEGTVKARIFRCRERLLDVRRRLLGVKET